jgi:cytosine deaminase
MPGERPLSDTLIDVLADVCIPASLLRAPDRFGGAAKQDMLRGQAVVQDGQITGLRPAPLTDHPMTLVPGWIEAHCHLDKCHSVKRMQGVGGDLSAALEAQRRDKALWDEADLRTRMTRGLAEYKASGTRVIRSHIDWSDTSVPPLAWSVLAELARTSDLAVQCAALTGIEQLAGRDMCFAIARHVAAQPGGVLGTFLLYHDPSHMRAGLQNAFAAAQDHGLALDFHVDEGLGDFNALELIADIALETGFSGPVLCGHAVSLADKDGADLARIIDKLLRARITVCALPTTNLYLQGRRDGTPDRRGLTRLRELHDAGVPIVVGSDNVGDAFCPMGQHDPCAALHLASLAAHLDPPMGDWLPLITLNAARGLGIDPPFVDTSPIDQLMTCAVGTTADLVAGRTPLIPFLHLQEAQTL